MSAWIVSPKHITVLVEGAIRLGVVNPNDAWVTGRMLTRANVKSIRARYGEEDEEAAKVKPYRLPTRQSPYPESLDDAVLLMQVQCYGYQTCEYDGYLASPAGKFVARMEAALAHVDKSSSAYSDAPWGV